MNPVLQEVRENASPSPMGPASPRNDCGVGFVEGKVGEEETANHSSPREESSISIALDAGSREHTAVRSRTDLTEPVDPAGIQVLAAAADTPPCTSQGVWIRILPPPWML